MLETNMRESFPKPIVAAAGKIRIALADDHPIFRDGLCRLLSFEDDFEVVGQVEDGSLVPELLQQCRPDILLLDLNMPGMNGLATLQKLQAQASRTRVILLTASDSQQDFVQALKLGSGGIVQKQAATDLLIASIRRVHAGELCMDSNVTAAVIRGFVEKEATAPRQMPPPAQNQRSSFSLSPRETEIVHLVTQGFKNIDMAQKMSISEQTVKNHLHNIFDKLEVTDRLELALCVIAGNFHVGLPPQPNSTW